MTQNRLAGTIMSLKINNRATPRQVEFLKELGYDGKWDISVTEAAQIIDELVDQQDPGYGPDDDVYYGN
jgi:hypothetical protein